MPILSQLFSTFQQGWFNPVPAKEIPSLGQEKPRIFNFTTEGLRNEKVMNVLIGLMIGTFFW